MNADGTFTSQDLLNFLDSQSNPDNGAESAPAPEQNGAVEAPATDAPAPEVDATPAPTDAPEVQVATQADKDANAFAQMRVQNKAYEDVLSKLAAASGIEYTGTDDLLAKLNDAAINKQAQKQGIPAEYLKRMEALEETQRRWDAMQNQNRLTQGFTALQSKYGLSAQEMQNFAATLDNERVNLANLDVVKEYEARNFESIVQSRIDKAVAEALAKNAQVDAHSTAPSAPGVGAGTHEQATIKSSNDLLNFLSANAPGFKR